MSEAALKKRGFGARFVNPFRSKQSSLRVNSFESSPSEESIEDLKWKSKEAVSRNRLRKGPLSKSTTVAVVQQTKPDATKGPRSKSVPFPAIDVSQAFQRNEQTGEVVDHTDLLHSLTEPGEGFQPWPELALLRAAEAGTLPGEAIVSQLAPDLWMCILEHLTPSDAASLSFSCKAFRDLLGFAPFHALKESDNFRQKIHFLMHMDKHLPGHLLCFTCAKFHLRTQAGQESLKPTNIANPLYVCPNLSATNKKLVRTRLTYGRTLPFTFVQLALRAHHHSPAHGVTTDSLSRRYKDRDGDWSHTTRYAIVNNHLLVRVISTHYAPPALPPAGLRHLLYDRQDFVPFFSVCAHWRDGELMPSVKCALSHIPKPPEGSGLVRVGANVKHRLHPPPPFVRLCEDCQPMRRCPECPTEYLIEMKMTEDRTDAVNMFKQALVVTRWSDLGDGSSPWSPEWAAINGEAEFDSFTAIGRRAISGIFESHFNRDLIPGHRIISMNPNKEKLGEAGHNWY